SAMPSGLPPLWGGRVLWADLDNDGRAEAIIGGIENQGITLGWSYGSTEQFPAKPLYRHYTRVLHWDEGSGSFLDSGMQLPSTLGFMGASMLCAVDFDNDGDLDLLSGGLITSKAGFVAGRGPGAELCKMFFLENLACGYFGQQRPNAAPAAPSALSAEALGQGKVRVNWSAPADDLTSAGALRYLLQLGTASGVYNLCSGNVAYGNAAMLLKPGLSIRRLPAGKLYWRVRAVDTSGKLSPWSGEASVDASGSEAIPSPGEPLPEQDLPLIQINAKALDSQGAESGGYVQLAGSSIQAGTGIAYVLATARPGWRFSHWEGPVDSPLARKTSVRAFEDSVVTARFVPDHELLYTAATHSAMRDRQGNVWAWSDSFLLPAATGPEWLQSEDGMPALAAASSPELRWLSLNDQQTWCGFSVGYDNAALDDPRNFPLDSLVQSHALDSSKWWTYNYAETSLALWCGGSNSMVAYFMNPSGVQSDYISFKGALMAVHPYDRWPTSATVNPGFVQAACTDSYALLLSQQGETWGIGANQCGQLGDGSQNPIDSFTPISGIPRFKALATNQAALEDQVAFSLGLDFQGRVWSWGNNRFGQLGQGTYENNDILEAQMLPPFPSPVIAIACGYRHALALCENGQVYAWGDNRQGQVGMGDGDGDGQLDQEIVAAPYALPGLDNVICIAAAARHSLALTEDEQLYGWGDNESGQINARTSAAMWTPTLVENAPKWQSDNGSLSIMLRSAADQPGSAVPYSGLGTVTPPPADYAARVGARLQVRAQDGERYRFLRWEGPVDEPDNPETWVNIGEGANSLCAVFELFAEELSLHIQSSPPEAGSTLPEAGLYSLAKNSSATLTALPRLNYVFEAWQSVSELGENARQAQFDWTFNSDLSLSAVFSPRQFRCQPKPNPDGGDYSLTSDGRLAHRVTAGSSTRLEFPEQFSEIKLLDLVGDSLALGNDGRLYAWGGNNYGELGNGASKSTYTALKDYNLVLDPDGQGHFSGAVKVYAG
ncbi:MAG: FG-GAP-like repeat-containing protein, partial [Lentisphaeria bacterium]|nr:FG-GAP-like repeat-containing protein [Lentisphaeria bacterium]